MRDREGEQGLLPDTHPGHNGLLQEDKMETSHFIITYWKDREFISQTSAICCLS